MIRNAKKSIIIAGLYCLFGRLALMFALPPGYASPVWPSAGIALALLIVYGYRFWPAVVAGSVLINLPTIISGNDIHDIVPSLFIASCIGFGAALQAITGSILIRKLVSSRPQLTEIRETLLFYTVGIISCVVSPTVGVSTLFLAKVIPHNNYLMHWGIWWSGDALGVFLFSALALAWFSPMKRTWKKRRVSLTVFSVLVMGVIFCLLYFGRITQNKNDQSRLESEAFKVKSVLEKQFNHYDLVLNAIQGFYKSSNFVDRKEFSIYVSHFSRSIPEFKSVAWVPKITHFDRGRFIEDAFNDGIENYKIKTVMPGGGFEETTDRSVYYPIYYIEPLDGNELALGINNGSESSRWEATQKAIDTGKIIISAPLILAQDKSSNKKSFILINAIYENGKKTNTTHSRREYIKGFITATVGIDPLMEKVLNESGLKHMQLTVRDVTGEDELIFRNKSKVYEVGDIDKYEFEFAHEGRVWRVVLRPTSEFFAAGHSNAQWFIVTGVLLFSGLLHILLLIVTGQTVEIQRVVADRTAELKKAKQSLEFEVTSKETMLQNLMDERSNFEKQRRATMIILNDLHEERKKLKIQNQALDNFAIVAETDPYGKIHYVNEGFLKVTGYPVSEILGKDYRDILNSGYHPKEFWKEFWSTIQSGKIWRGDIRNRTKSNEYFWVDKTVVLFVGDTGKIEKYISISVLITDKKNAESRLEEEREFLKKTNLELDSFVYTASHDLRAPLRGISSFASLLLKDYEGKLEAEGQLYLKKIDQGAKRMSQLINDLLALSRISRLEEPFEMTDMQEVLDTVLERIEFDIREKKVQLLIPHRLPCIKCNRTKITEVFLNLINNAIKFSSKENASDPIVEVGFIEEESFFRFYVKDNGIGIDKEYHEQIFGIFKRLHTNEEYEGTGLGLNIVKRVVEDHHGKIWIESEAGKGAIFCFTIPKDV